MPPAPAGRAASTAQRQPPPSASPAPGCCMACAAPQVPVLPGSPLLTSEADALAWAEKVGLPILLKATGGGGGIGIHICHTMDQART